VVARLPVDQYREALVVPAVVALDQMMRRDAPLALA